MNPYWNFLTILPDFVGFHLYRVIYSPKVNFLWAIFFTKLRILTFQLRYFCFFALLNKHSMSDASRYWQEDIIQSFSFSLWKNFILPFFKKDHKTILWVCPMSWNSPWILLICNRWAFTFVSSKDLICGFRQISFRLFLQNTFV